MSVPIPLDELPEQIKRFGPHAYVVTVGDDGKPRATSVATADAQGQPLASGVLPAGDPAAADPA